MRILDRYVLTKFALPFVYCFFGFLAVWFIFNLADNLQDFLQGHASFALLREYYLSQMPEIVVMSLPVSALLALLYSLTAMSRSNEIISMLGAGVSVVRILAPLMVVGVILAAISTWLNYRMAPHAAAIGKQILREIRQGEVRETALSGHLFRNREDHRTWFVRRLLLARGELMDVTIIQQDESGRVREKWYARKASYNPETRQWIFFEVFHAQYDEFGNEFTSLLEMQKPVDGWSETPWRISSSVMNPDWLSVPELEDYLTNNSDFPETRLAPYRTHWHYRWALPTFAIVVVFLAGPMGIVYSRRGILGGVATAIFLFFSMVFLSSIFLALGKGARLAPFPAAWLPPILFFALGCLLLWFRSTGRELPRLRMPWT